jgi:23S rRNA pseudouridine2605 synthase
VGSERLQKILARAGYGSRRSSEKLIEEGRVRVDGQVAKLGDSADISRQTVTVDGEKVRLPEEFRYIALYKPRGILSDTDDSRGRKTVLDLVPSAQRLFTVGRLDLTSEGLVLLTDDGALANRLLHPRYGHEREYQVLVTGRPPDDVLRKWRMGIVLDEEKTMPADVRVLRVESGNTWLKIVMREGKKRQIRRVAAALGHPVLKLIRVRIGPIRLGELKLGQWRLLSAGEVHTLRAETARTAKRVDARRRKSS